MTYLNKEFTFNRDNWTGEDATINVDYVAGAWRWKQEGYEIEVSGKKQYDDFTCYQVTIDGEPGDCSVGKWDNEPVWESANSDGSYSRQDKNAPVAVAKLLFNLI